MNSVCFAAPLARPILEPGFPCEFGGAEVRAVNFATGLAMHEDFDVSIILRSYRREQTRNLCGITTHYEPVPAPIAQTRDLRRDYAFLWNVLVAKLRKAHRSFQKKRERRESVHPRPRVLPFYSQLPDDIVCVFGVHHYSANVIKSSANANKRIVLFLASETDLDEKYNSDALNDYQQQSHMCRFALQNADRIVAQTKRQQTLLRERFGRSSTLIRNPIDLRLPKNKLPTPVAGDYILWVGRADTFSKRADKFFQLADACPEVKFVGVMNKRDERTFKSLLGQAPKNVEVVEHVPYRDIEDYYANASALLNTSDAEGFPNAFLQAAKYGVPILSLTVDPGEMLTRHKCGEHGGGDINSMIRIVSRFWRERNENRRSTLSDSILKYVREYHDLDQRVNELRDLLLEINRDTKNREAA